MTASLPVKIVQNARFRARRATMAATKITAHIGGYLRIGRRQALVTEGDPVFRPARRRTADDAWARGFVLRRFIPPRSGDSLRVLAGVR